MSRTRLALTLASALWISGCSITPTQNAETASAAHKKLQIAIEQEIQSLLTGVGKGLAHQTPRWTDLDPYQVRRGDTILGILRKVGAPESLFYELPRSDQQWLSHLMLDDKLLLLRQSGDVTGFAVKREKGGWRMAIQGQNDLVQQAELTIGPPRYNVVDLPLGESLEATFAGSKLNVSVQERFHAILSQVFTAETLPGAGWLRLRMVQHHHQESPLGDPLMVSAALTASVLDGPRFVVRIEAPHGGSAYYDGTGTKLAPPWLARPIEGEYRITSGFDPSRRHPITGRVRPHNGKDFAAARGTPVLAASDGKVVRAGWLGSWGKLLVLRHSAGIETRYAHLSHIEGLSVGDRVKQGEVIGRVGSTGLSSGPHLHFEVHANGQAHDPATFDPSQLTSASDAKLSGDDLRGVAAYRELEEEALAQLPSGERLMVAGGEALYGLGGPSPEDELPSK